MVAEQVRTGAAAGPRRTGGRQRRRARAQRQGHRRLGGRHVAYCPSGSFEVAAAAAGVTVGCDGTESDGGYVTAEEETDEVEGVLV